MVELVDTQASEACVRKDMRVRVPLRPPTNNLKVNVYQHT